MERTGVELVEFEAGGLDAEDFFVALAFGVAEGDAEEEAVELVFGEEVGAFEFEGVLRGDDHEGGGERAGGAVVDGDGVVVHGFEERGLGGGGWCG